jgi:hypothetical protein
MDHLDLEEQARQRYEYAAELIIRYQLIEQELDKTPSWNMMKRLQLKNEMQSVDKEIQLIKKLI